MAVAIMPAPMQPTVRSVVGQEEDDDDDGMECVVVVDDRLNVWGKEKKTRVVVTSMEKRWSRRSIKRVDFLNRKQDTRTSTSQNQ